MDRLSHFRAAIFGLLLSLGPNAAHALFPGSADLTWLGPYVLGGLIGFCACRLRASRH